MISARSELCQRRSKRLFGQVHRLAVMIAIAHASDGRVTPTQLAEDLGLVQSAFQAPLRDLLDDGLISREVDGRRNVYVRQDSKAWDWIFELEEQLEAEASKIASVTKLARS